MLFFGAWLDNLFMQDVDFFEVVIYQIINLLLPLRDILLWILYTPFVVSEDTF